MHAIAVAVGKAATTVALVYAMAACARACTACAFGGCGASAVAAALAGA